MGLSPNLSELNVTEQELRRRAVVVVDIYRKVLSSHAGVSEGITRGVSRVFAQLFPAVLKGDRITLALAAQGDSEANQLFTELFPPTHAIWAHIETRQFHPSFDESVETPLAPKEKSATDELADEEVAPTGLATHRWKDNPEEQRFAEAWKKVNTYPYKTLMHLLRDYKKPSYASEPTARDAAVAATVIQWLGSPVGLNFLAELGYCLNKPSKNVKKPT